MILILTFQSKVQAKFKPRPSECSVYQFSVPVEGRRAFLCIPEDCHYVRALIISLENSLERNWLEDPLIRQMAAKEGLGIIWLADGKPSNITFEMKPDAVTSLQQMFADLAKESGYAEVEFAPLVVMGHSWNGRIAWTFTNANPERVLAAIPIRTYPLPEKLNFSGIPFCYVVGEMTELPQYSDGRPGDRDFYWPIVRKTAIDLRTVNENNLIGVVTDPGGNHTNWATHQAEFVALYISKACQFRLPNEKPLNGKVSLKKMDKTSGWLTDTGGMEPDQFLPAPYKEFKGDPRKAYWFFDEETAKAAIAFNGDRKKRETQMPTFVQEGKILPVDKSGYVQLKFFPEHDGLTFHLKGGFLLEVPESLVGAGNKLNHSPVHFSFSVTHGPVLQTGANKFRIQFDRQTFRIPVIQITQKEDKYFRRAIQPGKLNIPMNIREGRTQLITFPNIGNQPRSVKSLKLRATTDSGLPVNYFVESGPAIIKGNQLIFTKIPPCSKFPLKVTVVGFQWGRIIEPFFQTAAQVRQSFVIY